MFVNENGFDSEEYRRFERARPYKLRKNSDSPRFWEGHDFTGCGKNRVS
jgi:hypothetical protein